MAALGSKARALVHAGRTALRPAAGDRERIEAALRVRLGPAALPPQGSVAPPPVAAAAGWQVAAGTVLGIGLIGSALYVAFWPERGPAPQAGFSTRSVASAPVVTPSVAEPPPSEARTPLETVKTPPPTVNTPAAAAPSDAQGPRARDRLAEEVALLSRATKALRAGRAGEALKALDEHQSRFPRGALSEERRAAKAEALCSLGRMSEGHAELAHLAPQSPAAARAKQACDPAN